jgi:hypothetical protein
MTKLSSTYFIGNPRGNLECDFAQPSLLIFLIKLSPSIKQKESKMKEMLHYPSCYVLDTLAFVPHSLSLWLWVLR